MEVLWKTKLPLKIKIFLWQLIHDRLQTANCLKKKGWKGSTACVLCKQKETVNHIFFRCPLAVYAWCIFRDCFGWSQIPNSISDVWARMPSGKCIGSKSLDIFFFAGFLWSCWRIRNKMVIERQFPKPSDVMYSGLSYLQKWKILLKEKD